MASRVHVPRLAGIALTLGVGCAGGCVRTTSSPPRDQLLMAYAVSARTEAGVWQPFLMGRYSASVVALRKLDEGYCLDLAIKGESATLEETVELARLLDEISVQSWRDSVWVRQGDHHRLLRSPTFGDDYASPGITGLLVWPLIPLPPSLPRGPAPTWVVGEEPPIVVQVLRFTLRDGEELVSGETVDVRFGNGLFWWVWMERRDDLVFKQVVVEQQSVRSRWWRGLAPTAGDAGP